MVPDKPAAKTNGQAVPKVSARGVPQRDPAPLRAIAANTRRLADADGLAKRQSQLIGLVADALDHREFQHAALAMANEFATLFNCQRVSIGTYHGKRLEVDVLSDTRLPFKEDSVDLILSLAVLEHISRPSLAVSEMLRCLRPNGELLVFVPFMQPLHAAPYDYQRWTEAGLREVFRDFVILQSGIGAGPTSGFLWVLQHWIALLLSFGSSTIKDLLLIALMIVTFPLKYLDIPLEHFVRSGDIASGFYVHAMKPDTK